REPVPAKIALSPVLNAASSDQFCLTLAPLPVDHVVPSPSPSPLPSQVLVAACVVLPPKVNRITAIAQSHERSFEANRLVTPANVVRPVNSFILIKFISLT